MEEKTTEGIDHKHPYRNEEKTDLKRPDSGPGPEFAPEEEGGSSLQPEQDETQTDGKRKHRGSPE